MLYVSPTQDNKYELISSYTYESITVPKGYKTNGADVPRIFWSFVPPFKPKYLPAVVVHDYLCDLKDFKTADYIFEIHLLEIENSFTTKVMVKAVKLYTRWFR